MSVKDKVIIITGASSGIGKGIAIHLSNLGAKCVLMGRNEERLNNVRKECKNETLVYSFDLIDFDKYQWVIDDIYSRFGKIYGFVHSAGIQQTKPISTLLYNDLKEIFEINVFSPLLFSKIISKKKYIDQGQSYVFIASIMGVVGNKCLSTYSATKGSLISMTKSMALELADKNIRVNSISPGHIDDTEMAVQIGDGLSIDALNKIQNDHPLGLGRVKDISCMIEFLLSENSRWVTGQNLIVDGGYTIH
jgi:NAD(P)-dependent dehydrogenase (short-subunit alcohol dehydrogenase family)